MSATILKATYDYTIEPHQGDPLVDLADTAIAQFSIATQPGLWMVDVMPFRKSYRYKKDEKEDTKYPQSNTCPTGYQVLASSEQPDYGVRRS